MNTQLLPLLSLALIFSFTGFVQADPFAEGIAAYEAGNYSKALEEFEAASNEASSPATHHNLALTYLKLEQPAAAVWHMERAILLDPRNNAYRYKLNALREQLGLFATQLSWYQQAAQLLRMDQWILLATGGAWAWLALTLLPKIADTRLSQGLKFGRSLSLVLLLLCISALALQRQSHAHGIIIADAAIALHAAPASAAPTTGTARPGERAIVIDRHNHYLHIRTEAEARGWIPDDSYQALMLPKTDA
jgi:tetratricopeptide (TPR) repeat protein